ncbi:MAG: T9SS type A sorting domain-containing protein [Bacteroidia bacterium]|nr:T9SS type A sorting domain-containing protein [Bacteroidia bacterium]
MKKIWIIYIFLLLFFRQYSQLNYSFSSTTSTFTYITGGTNALTSNTADDELSSAITLPFTFYYNCQPYTQVKISSNGWLTFDMSLTSSMFTNDLDNTGSLIVAPLWDDLQCTQNVQYVTTGSSPNRIFKVEWRNMEWNFSATTAVISFQVWLYEGTNRIEFWYQRESGGVNSGSASIGLNGSGSPIPFLSLNNTSGSPTASSTTETDNLNTKPANGQIYRWDPISCSGTPSGYALALSLPSNTCSPYTATLNVTGTSVCGLQYTFQSGTSSSGPWTTFQVSTSNVATFNVTGLTYFRAIVTCTISSNSMTTNTLSANLGSTPCVCDLIQIATLPFTSGAQTTCGKGNDLTSTNVSNICGSSSYYTGEDVVYSFTPTTTGQISINLTSGGSYTGLMLYQGCPFSGGTCITYTQSSTGNKSLSCISVVAGQVYYLVIDSWASPTCNPYNLSISAVTPVSGGCACMGSIISIPSLPYSHTGQTTCGKIDDVTSSNVSNVCGSSSYYTGEDVVYTFTPTATGQISITINSSGSYTGLMLYKGCPSSGGTCVNYSQSSTGSKTLTCLNVIAGQTYYLIIDSWASPTCNPYDLSISAVNTSGVCNMNYTPSSVAYNFESFTGTSLPMTDDVLFSSIVMFGFSTCFDGAVSWGGYPASNSSFVYDAICNIPNISSSTIAAPNVWTGWSITNAAPIFGTSIPRNAILGPWHDINPATTATVATSKIQYATFGTAPNRRTVISWEDIPYFSCNASLTPYFSGQIKIFENGNIEIHIKNKHVCTSWNGGYAVLGLHNYDGTVYIPPVNMTAHNYPTQWTMTNTAYRFTPAASCVTNCQVLPIGFKSFYGERIAKTNYLHWETAEESNLMNYEILRSTDGINFEKIGRVKPNNFPSKYQFEDITAPLGKISYYKIRSVESNEKSSETQIIAIDAQMGEVFVTSIYPNPVNEEVTLSIESRLTVPNGMAKVNVFDVYGKQVLCYDIKLLGGINDYKIDVNSLSQGIYIFEVVINGNEKVIKKIVKE